mmetsp:Transcript_34727/g.63101  ORF Transcript_34727/g.63101 Transcript_34727/m.63101 type:complete len:329 (-) Transcript_34727:582-1568(-)
MEQMSALVLASLQLPSSSARMNEDVFWTRSSRSAAEVHVAVMTAGAVVGALAMTTGVEVVVVDMGHEVVPPIAEEVIEAEADGGLHQCFEDEAVAVFRHVGGEILGIVEVIVVIVTGLGVVVAIACLHGTETGIVEPSVPVAASVVGAWIGTTVGERPKVVAGADMAMLAAEEAIDQKSQRGVEEEEGMEAEEEKQTTAWMTGRVAGEDAVLEPHAQIAEKRMLLRRMSSYRPEREGVVPPVMSLAQGRPELRPAHRALRAAAPRKRRRRHHHVALPRPSAQIGERSWTRRCRSRCQQQAKHSLMRKMPKKMLRRRNKRWQKLRLRVL